MADLKALLDKHSGITLPKSLLGKAISYGLNQWQKLKAFLDNPLVPIDNNATERAIRPFTIGRKNWSFSCTPDGAHASAAIYSLIESAKANNIEPYAYLALIFKELPIAKSLDDFEKLLPHKARNYFELSSYN